MALEIIHEGDAAVAIDGEPDGNRLLKVSGGKKYRLSEPSHEAMLSTVASFGGCLALSLEKSSVDSQFLLSVRDASAGTATWLIEAFDEHADIYQRLNRKRAQPVERAAGRVVELLVQSAYDREVSNEQLEQRAQAAIDVFRVLVDGNRRQLESVIDALEPLAEDDPEEIDVEEAEARARLRQQAMYRKIVQDSLSVAELKEWGLSRQRLKQLRDEDRLFAIDVPYHRGLLYPAWQFDSTHRPRAIMPTLVRAAKEGRLDAIGFHHLMTGARDEGARRAVELLDDGREDLVFAMIRAADR